MKQLSLLRNNRDAALTCVAGSCPSCREALEFLRRKTRPSAPTTSADPIRAVDLFAGCGGMSIGLEEAARKAGRAFDVSLAVDSDEAVLRLYRKNIRTTTASVGDVAALFDGQIGTRRKTAIEAATKRQVGAIDVLLGGPPCQGHSDLNNHTRRKDPKNALYLRMARAAEILGPKVVVIENVTPVQWDRSKVVETTSAALRGAGYQVHGQVLDLRRLGVPQRRFRYVLLASRILSLDPRAELATVADALPNHPDRTVGWAIGDLLSPTGRNTFDTASCATQENARRIEYLFEHKLYDLPNDQRPVCHQDGEHSYVSMYGRLWWEKPAQTITTGFGSMGQGRFIHPKDHRTITPHEAARLQTFPDWYDFGAQTKRGVLAKVIGNAVPPLLMVALGGRIVAALDDERLRTTRRPA